MCIYSRISEVQFYGLMYNNINQNISQYPFETLKR